MHDLFTQVLDKRDLSKAGDLFMLQDEEIVNDLPAVLQSIQNISNEKDYAILDNDQSVVEISITRVIGAIRDTSTIETHAPSLMSVLSSCLEHDLKPSSRDSDSPHAKIASDILSCVFLNYSKKSVMKVAIPIAVKFLQKGNKELCRSLTSYLSLAAIMNADLLSLHMHPLIDSIKHGNISLIRVLPQIYSQNKQPINDNVTTLINLLPKCENTEKTNLLHLLELVAKDSPQLLEGNIQTLCNYLQSSQTSALILQIFIEMCSANPGPFTERVQVLKQTAAEQPATLSLVVRVVGLVGRLSQEHAKNSLNYLTSQLHSVEDENNRAILLREIKNITDIRRNVLADYINDIQQYSSSSNPSVKKLVQQLRNDYANRNMRLSQENRMSGSVTLINVGGQRSELDLSRPKSSFDFSQDAAGKGNIGISNPADRLSHTSIPRSSAHSLAVSHTDRARSMERVHSRTGLRASHPESLKSVRSHSQQSERSSQSTLTNGSSYRTLTAHQVGERPHDPIRQFCTKHLDKINNFISNNIVFRIPMPSNCIADFRGNRTKRYGKVYFACAERGEHCLYNHTYLTMKTRYPRIWIHMMFLTLQARSEKPLTKDDQQVMALKSTWDSVKNDGKSFVALITSAFPSIKEQEILLDEVKRARYFDVFEYISSKRSWACFLCVHPERALVLEDGDPVIEGQLKEKKGRWKLFRRWRTRYFTLSGARLTYKGSSQKRDDCPIDVRQIQSVKAVGRGVRSIPKVFEIFTQDRTYVFKAKDSKNAEQWVRCLQIAVAHSQARGYNYNATHHSVH